MKFMVSFMLVPSSSSVTASFFFSLFNKLYRIYCMSSFSHNFIYSFVMRFVVGFSSRNSLAIHIIGCNPRASSRIILMFVYRAVVIFLLFFCYGKNCEGIRRTCITVRLLPWQTAKKSKMTQWFFFSHFSVSDFHPLTTQLPLKFRSSHS